MNRRSLLAMPAGFVSQPAHTSSLSRTHFAAYYLLAHTYTIVPRHVREDMKWVAALGTRYLCVTILEQDFSAAKENLDIIFGEARREGMQVLAIPSRWGAVVAGAPKVPSSYTTLHPESWAKDMSGRYVQPAWMNRMTSIHDPGLLVLFSHNMERLVREHQVNGIILDEPKAFFEDGSEIARKSVGANAGRKAHLAAASRFYSAVATRFRELLPNGLVCVSQQSHYPDDVLQACASISPLSWFGCDGRPWTPEADARWTGLTESESGRGKLLLGKGLRYLEEARRRKLRSWMLVENHNLSTPDMIDAMEKHLPAVLELGVDILAFYYFPRNVAQPDRAMNIIARNLTAAARR